MPRRPSSVRPIPAPFEVMFLNGRPAARVVGYRAQFMGRQRYMEPVYVRRDSPEWKDDVDVEAVGFQSTYAYDAELQDRFDTEWQHRLAMLAESDARLQAIRDEAQEIKPWADRIKPQLQEEPQ